VRIDDLHPGQRQTFAKGELPRYSSSWEVKMIIDQCRKLALRAPARVVFPDALDVRVLKAGKRLAHRQVAVRIDDLHPGQRQTFAKGELPQREGAGDEDPQPATAAAGR
jgi:hypothetical protein